MKKYITYNKLGFILSCVKGQIKKEKIQIDDDIFFFNLSEKITPTFKTHYFDTTDDIIKEKTDFTGNIPQSVNVHTQFEITNLNGPTEIWVGDIQTTTHSKTFRYTFTTKGIKKIYVAPLKEFAQTVEIEVI